MCRENYLLEERSKVGEKTGRGRKKGEKEPTHQPGNVKPSLLPPSHSPTRKKENIDMEITRGMTLTTTSKLNVNLNRTKVRKGSEEAHYLEE